jgi:hypothetical protein
MGSCPFGSGFGIGLKLLLVLKKCRGVLDPRGEIDFKSLSIRSYGTEKYL